MSTTTTSTGGGFLDGISDLFGGIINGPVGQTALDIYKTREASDAAKKAAEAQAKADLLRAQAQAATTQAQATTASNTTRMILLAGAGVLGLGVIVWAATRRR